LDARFGIASQAVAKLLAISLVASLGRIDIAIAWPTAQPKFYLVDLVPLDDFP
jgi:hypothetical protein